MIVTLLVSVGIISAIALFLALLMVIADATIGNYGIMKIDINNGSREIEVEGGQSLLKALMDEGIFIPSACGGRGSCGLCKVQVLEGAGQYLPTELPWISPEEQKENIRLSCQCKVKNNLKIVIPEELFSVRQFDTVVDSIRDLTYDIKEIRLKVAPGQEPLEAKAGQFIQFEVPAYEDYKEDVYRAYSMANPPSDHGFVELQVRLVPHGVCTTYVHQYLKVGDEVSINGPYGDFYLRDSERDIICIAGGSGMAPIKAILMDMADRGIERKTTYFFGARSRRDLFMVDEMQALEQTMPNFTFIPALSQPTSEDQWEGEQGIITDVVRKHLSNASNCEAYMCGSPGMIDACAKVLLELGLDEEHIYYDKF